MLRFACEDSGDRDNPDPEYRSGLGVRLMELLPIKGATASDIRDVKEPGLVLPVRKQDAPLLLTKVSGEMTAIVLSGKAAFLHFPIKLRDPHIGLFVPDVEVVVDFSTATDGSALWQTSGVLILDHESLSIVARQAGNDFNDPNPIPLWSVVQKGSDSVRIAFTSWGLAVRDRDKLTVLFEHKHGAGTIEAPPV